MSVSINISYNNIKSEIKEVTSENIDSVIEFTEKLSGKGIEINDPNPQMCYVNGVRVIPGTDIKLRYTSVDLNDWKNDPDKVVIPYEIEGRTLINCTPHPITLREIGCGRVQQLLNSSCCPRLFTELEKSDSPKMFYKQLAVNCQLPEPMPNTWFIVSKVIFDAFPERLDLICPNSLYGDKDENGKIVSVTSFIEH